MSSLLDDSDDDSLDDVPIFTTKRKRAEEKKVQKGMDYLDDALADEEHRRQRQHRIDKIKYEHQDSDDERLQRAVSIASEGHLSAGERRLATQNAINGVDDNGDEDLDQGRREDLASAFTSRLSILLGTRCTLSGGQTDELYTSVAEATKDLQTIVSNLLESDNSAIEEKTIAKNINSAIRCGLLADFLEDRTLATRCQNLHLNQLPQELEEWLFKVACSAGRGELRAVNRLCVGSFQTLQALWQRSKEPSKMEFMSLSNLVPCLEKWFGLQTEGSAVLKDSVEAGSEPSRHAVGMKHFLLFWEQAISGGMVSFTNSPEDDAASMSNSIVALVRAGLDPSFHIGEGLMKALQRLLLSLLDSISLQVDFDDAKTEEWMTTTVRRVLKQCATLGPGAKNSEDQHDGNAWLCLPLVVRICSSHISDLDSLAKKFSVCMSIHALELSLKIDDWEKHLSSTLSETGRIILAEKATESLRWKAIASSYVALFTVLEISDDIKQDGPRCLSTVNSLFYGALSGVSMFPPMATQPDDTVGFEERATVISDDESVGNARELHDVLDYLEANSKQLANTLGRRATIADFRLAEYSLTFMRQFFLRQRDQIAKTAGLEEKQEKQVQKGIASFFSPAEGESQ